MRRAAAGTGDRVELVEYRQRTPYFRKAI